MTSCFPGVQIRPETEACFKMEKKREHTILVWIRYVDLNEIEKNKLIA